MPLFSIKGGHQRQKKKMKSKHMCINKLEEKESAPLNYFRCHGRAFHQEKKQKKIFLGCFFVGTFSAHTK